MSGSLLPLTVSGSTRSASTLPCTSSKGRVSDEDLARRGRLLEARRDIDRVASGQPFGRASDDCAGVDPDARQEAKLRQRVAHLDCGSHRPERIVLVHVRHAEDGHDRIADELLDRAAVRLDDALHALEVARELGAQRLGIGRLRQGGGAGDVAEDDGDRLTLLALRGRGCERSGTVAAEPEAGRILLAAVGANGHGADVRRPSFRKLGNSGCTATQRTAEHFDDRIGVPGQRGN